MTRQDTVENEPVNAPIWPKPPVVALIFALAGLALGRLVPLGSNSASWESTLVGVAIMACAVGIVALAAREMGRARTTFIPGEQANALVTYGPFQRSRNPMYLSLVLFLAGLGVATVNPWLIALAPLLAIYLNYRVIKREEAYLQQRFGETYAQYKRKVRRWF